MAILGDFKSLKTFADVAFFLNTTPKSLGDCLYHIVPQYRYKAFQIPKRGGGQRIIHAPCQKLKQNQRKLAHKLSLLYEELHPKRQFVTGFRLKHSCILGAQKHIRQKHVVNIDLQDFFTQITFPRVYGLFLKEPFGLPKSVAATLAQICTFTPSVSSKVSGATNALKSLPHLPQGAPTSPVVSNFILNRLDNQLRQYVKGKNIRYSRYADDLTFSTSNENSLEFLGTVCSGKQFELSARLRSIIVHDNCFEINEGKIRHYTKTKRQVVTGLIVNQKVNVSRKYVSQLRAMFHDWELNGEETATQHHLKFCKHFSWSHGECPLHIIVEGKLGFLKQVIGETWKYKQLKFQYDKLTGAKEPVIFSRGRALLEQGIYVLDERSRNDQAEYTNQGTAFSLKGVGLITNRHVLEGARINDCLKGRQPRVENELFAIKHSSQEKFRLHLERCGNTDAEDYAVLSICDLLQQPCFECRTDICKIDEELLIVGYPHYNKTELVLTSVKVCGIRTVEGIGYYEVDQPIVFGNSGGPVFDQNGYVVGIATRGGHDIEEGKEVVNLVLPIGKIVPLMNGSISISQMPSKELEG